MSNERLAFLGLYKHSLKIQLPPLKFQRVFPEYISLGETFCHKFMGDSPSYALSLNLSSELRLSELKKVLNVGPKQCLKIMLPYQHLLDTYFQQKIKSVKLSSKQIIFKRD